MYDILMLTGALVALGIVVVVLLVKKGRPGAAQIVPNTQRKGNEAHDYVLVFCQLDGDDTAMLLTQNEVDGAIERALSHPEDVWSKR